MESVQVADLATLRSNFVRQLEFLDSLAAMGEEDYEIEWYVVKTSRLAAQLLVHRLQEISPNMGPSLGWCEITAEAMFRWIYQVNLNRRSSIKRLSDRLFEGFFVQVLEELRLAHDPDKESIFFAHAQLFIAIDQAGAQVNSALRERQIRRCMRKICKMAPEKLAVN